MSDARPLTDDERTALCTACGLCCDGSLFGLVPLAHDEVANAKLRRLDVLDDRALTQPCGALGADRRCAIYAERPRACRVFTCQLFARRDGSLSERLATVSRARALLDALDAADLRPELDDAPARTEHEQALVDELGMLLEQHFGRA